MEREPEPWADADAPPVRRPLGVTVAALFYIVLGSHALMFGSYLALLDPGAARSAAMAGLLVADPGFVRGYGALLAAIALPFFAIGVGLVRGRAWARWLALASVALHIVGPPFQLGGVLFAAVANTYLWGSGAVDAWLRRPGPGAPARPGGADAPQP